MSSASSKKGNNSNNSEKSGQEDLTEEYISLADLWGETKKTRRDASKIDEVRQEESTDEQRELETHITGWEKYYELRDKWSLYIFVFVMIMVIFQITLTAAIGFKWVDFLEYKGFLYVIIGENFAQIVGMGYIVAHHLFPNSAQTPNRKLKDK